MQSFVLTEEKVSNSFLKKNLFVVFFYTPEPSYLIYMCYMSLKMFGDIKNITEQILNPYRIKTCKIQYSAINPYKSSSTLNYILRIWKTLPLSPHV